MLRHITLLIGSVLLLNDVLQIDAFAAQKPQLSEKAVSERQQPGKNSVPIPSVPIVAQQQQMNADAPDNSDLCEFAGTGSGDARNAEICRLQEATFQLFQELQALRQQSGKKSDAAVIAKRKNEFMRFGKRSENVNSADVLADSLRNAPVSNENTMMKRKNEFMRFGKRGNNGETRENGNDENNGGLHENMAENSAPLPADVASPDEEFGGDAKLGLQKRKNEFMRLGKRKNEFMRFG